MLVIREQQFIAFEEIAILDLKRRLLRHLSARTPSGGTTIDQRLIPFVEEGIVRAREASLTEEFAVARFLELLIQHRGIVDIADLPGRARAILSSFVASEEKLAQFEEWLNRMQQVSLKERAS